MKMFTDSKNEYLSTSNNLFFYHITVYEFGSHSKNYYASFRLNKKILYNGAK